MLTHQTKNKVNIIAAKHISIVTVSMLALSPKHHCVEVQLLAWLQAPLVFITHWIQSLKCGYLLVLVSYDG